MKKPTKPRARRGPNSPSPKYRHNKEREARNNDRKAKPSSCTYSSVEALLNSQT